MPKWNTPRACAQSSTCGRVKPSPRAQSFTVFETAGAAPQACSGMRRSRARGMEYVTITDHGTIEGCLQIRALPNTFISEQVTTYFPGDACKIHLLVWGITEAQHADIVILRDNIFALQRYLQAGQIAHAV